MRPRRIPAGRHPGVRPAVASPGSRQVPSSLNTTPPSNNTLLAIEKAEATTPTPFTLPDYNVSAGCSRIMSHLAKLAALTDELVEAVISTSSRVRIPCRRTHLFKADLTPPD